MIIDYALIEAERLTELEKYVKENISNGWQPFGNLVIKTEKVGRGADAKEVQKYCQVVVLSFPPMLTATPGNPDIGTSNPNITIGGNNEGRTPDHKHN